MNRKPLLSRIRRNRRAKRPTRAPDIVAMDAMSRFLLR